MAEMTANISRPRPIPQPRMAMRYSRSVLRKTLRNHMAGLLGSLHSHAVILVVAQEDFFQAGFLAGQAGNGVLRRRLDDVIQPARDGEVKRMPIGKRLRLLHTR